MSSWNMKRWSNNFFWEKIDFSFKFNLKNVRKVWKKIKNCSGIMKNQVWYEYAFSNGNISPEKFPTFDSTSGRRNRCLNSKITVWTVIWHPKFFWLSSVILLIHLLVLYWTLVKFGWKVWKLSFSLSICMLKSRELKNLLYLFQKTTLQLVYTKYYKNLQT